MKTLEMAVAEVKKRFSEAVNQAAFSTCRIVITKRSHDSDYRKYQAFCLHSEFEGGELAGLKPRTHH